MLRNLACILTTVVWTTCLFFVSSVVLIITFNQEAALWVARKLWSPVLLWVGGARLEIEGRENVDPHRPTVYVSNHQSTIDIPVLFTAIPVNLRFIAKSQLRWVPFLGWYMWLTRHIFIDRSNRQRALASLEKAARCIRSGISVIAYAEGTRSRDGRVLPFKKGSFELALRAGAAVCPVTIEGSSHLMPKNSWKITPGKIRVRIGKPIAAAEFAELGRDGLAEHVRDIIIAQNLEMGGRGGG